MTYISLTDAKTWVAAHVKSTKRVAWDALSDADKTIALQEAEDEIDQLHFRGQRYEPKYLRNGAQIDYNSDGLTQTQEWPRIINDVTVDWDHATNKPLVPQFVKDAVCLEAVAIAKHDADDDAVEREDLQQQGVQSISEGGQISETFAPGARHINSGLKSSKAYKLLSPWIARSFRIV